MYCKRKRRTGFAWFLFILTQKYHYLLLITPSFYVLFNFLHEYNTALCIVGTVYDSNWHK